MGRRTVTEEEKTRKAFFKELLREHPIQTGQDLNTLVREFVSSVIGDGLEAELDEELGYSKYDYKNKQTDNSRNGSYEKTLHTSYGDTEIKVPRDRQGEFEPQLVKKHQNTLTQDMEEKIISMYAKGMTTGDMESHVRELYGLELSDSTISRITDKILPLPVSGSSALLRASMRSYSLTPSIIMSGRKSASSRRLCTSAWASTWRAERISLACG
jgi:putative transposase